MEILYLPFAMIMRLFESFSPNYAISLLLFTILFKVVLFPLGIKQQKNQIKMAALRPKEEAIRKKYAGRNDQATMQKMQQEIMDLQQRENVSPFGGCLPLVIQLGLVLVIYAIIRQPLTYICEFTKVELVELFNAVGFMNGAEAFTESTLGRADQFKAIANIETFDIGTLSATIQEKLSNLPNLDFFGLNLGYAPIEVWNAYTSKSEIVAGFAPKFIDVVKYTIIPVLCFGLQVVTTKLTRKFTYQSPATQQAQSGCSMKMMDWMMPLMSLWFCYTFSSAIGLYWIYSNIFSFGQTVLLAKLMPIPKVTEEELKAAEKELKAKESGTRKSSEKIRVRSLHHIDDDDYDTLPEVQSEVKGAGQTLLNGAKVETNKSTKAPKVKD